MTHLGFEKSRYSHNTHRGSSLGHCRCSRGKGLSKRIRVGREGAVEFGFDDDSETVGMLRSLWVV